VKAKIATLTLTGLLNASLFHEVALASEGNKNQELIKHGEYLVSYGGCNDCHTPKVSTPKGPEPDTNKLLSGYPSTAALPKTHNQNLNTHSVGPGIYEIDTIQGGTYSITVGQGHHYSR
jgi:mono/diheme cytochrome c family protein